MRRNLRWLGPVAVALSAAVLVPLAGAAAPAPGPASAGVAADDPGAGPWAQVPRDQVAARCGLDPVLLDQANAALPGIPFTIVRHGKLCWVNRPADTTSTYHVASVTKTFAATLFGMIAQRSSTLEDTDPVREWLSSWEAGPIDPRATLAHVLAMTSTKSNLATDQKGGWSYDALGWREINRLITVMNRAIQREPAAFPGVTDVQQFAQRYLFDVLGMR
ncbi:serine hydrolase, partial [Actinokineospora iranica]